MTWPDGACPCAQSLSALSAPRALLVTNQVALPLDVIMLPCVLMYGPLHSVDKSPIVLLTLNTGWTYCRLQKVDEGLALL